MNNKIENALVIVAAIICFGALGWLMMTGVSRTEVAECQNWEKQAKEYPKFYLLKWQKNQCLHYEIDIDTMVI